VRQSRAVSVRCGRRCTLESIACVVKTLVSMSACATKLRYVCNMCMDTVGELRGTYSTCSCLLVSEPVPCCAGVCIQLQQQQGHQRSRLCCAASHIHEHEQRLSHGEASLFCKHQPQLCLMSQYGLSASALSVLEVCNAHSLHALHRCCTRTAFRARQL